MPSGRCQVEMSKGQCRRVIVRDSMCIFHLKNKNEEEAEGFKRAISKELMKLKSGVTLADFRGFVFPRGIRLSDFCVHLKGPIVFSEATFEKEAVFVGVTFSKKADFSGATFMSKADWSNTKFAEKADFSGATFKGEVGMFDAEFQKEADFSLSTFEEDVFLIGSRFQGRASFAALTCSGKVDLFGCVFHDEAIFSQASFKNANFSESQFKAAYFSRTEFSGIAQFLNATFSGEANFFIARIAEADFKKARFENTVNIIESSSGKIDFSGSLFSGKVTFEGVEFNESDFSQVRFEDRTVFNNSDFAVARFDGSKFHGKVEFSNCRFSKVLRFSGALLDEPSIVFTSASVASVAPGNHAILGRDCLLAFDHVQVRHPTRLEFREVDMSRISLLDTNLKGMRFLKARWVRYNGRDTTYDEMILNEKAEGDPESVAELYRRLRQNYEESLRYTDAGDFFIGEMEMRKRSMLSVDASRGTHGPSFSSSIWITLNQLGARIAFYGYDILGRYGESYWRPILLSPMVMILFLGIRLLISLVSQKMCFSQISQLILPTLRRSVFVFFQLQSEDVLDLFERVFSGILLGLTFIALRRRLERHGAQ